MVSNLSNPNPQVVEWSGIALGDIGFDAVQPVAAVLSSSTATVPARVAAAKALGMTKAKAATAPLIKAAAGADAQVRDAAVKALSEVGDEEATDVLVKALTDKSPEVRDAAMSLLRNWRMGDVDTQLKTIMGGEDVDAARRAAVVLAQHVSAAGGGLLASLMRTSAEEQPTADTGQMRTLLEEASGDPAEDPKVREAAITALGYVGNDESLAALEPLLTGASQYAVIAAKAVGHIGERQAMAEELDEKHQTSKAAQMLLDMFKSAPNDEVRLVAGAGLSLMSGQAVKPLVDMMQGANELLRPWIAGVLAAIAKPATDTVLDARGKASDTQLRAWYAATLKLIGDARALDMLESLPKEEQPDPAKVEAGQKILTELNKAA